MYVLPGYHLNDSACLSSRARHLARAGHGDRESLGRPTGLLRDARYVIPGLLRRCLLDSEVNIFWHVCRTAIALLLVGLLSLSLSPTANAAVTLLYVKAESQADGILVSWETATELNTAAFRLYRAQTQDGPWDLLGDSQQAADGEIAGQTYHYLDANVTPGVTYYYLLEEIETNNNLIQYDAWIASATAGATATPPATLTPMHTSTATRTATTTRTATCTPTHTSTATRTPTPTATFAPASHPTATRGHPNTPSPMQTLPPSVQPSTRTPPPATATPLPPAQIATPTGKAVSGLITATATPPAAATAAPVSGATMTLTPRGVTPLPTSKLVPASSHTPLPTRALTALSSKATAPPMLPDVMSSPTPAPTPMPLEQAIRNSRLILFLGGGAIGLAALLIFLAIVVWWLRRR